LAWHAPSIRIYRRNRAWLRSWPDAQVRRRGVQLLVCTFALVGLHEALRYLFLIPKSIPWAIFWAVQALLFVSVLPLLDLPRLSPRSERISLWTWWGLAFVMAAWQLFLDGVGVGFTRQILWFPMAALSMATLVLVMLLAVTTQETVRQRALHSARALEDGERRPGRRPSPITRELRHRLQEDHEKGQLKPAKVYAKWYAKQTGSQWTSALQTVYRELRRLKGPQTDDA
jgi:hypothetical protein